MLIDLLGNGKLQVSDSKICSKYIAKGLVEGFVSKEDLKKVILENDLKINVDCIPDKSEQVILWDLHREDSKSDMHVYIDVDNTIVEAKITMTPRYSKMKILDEDYNTLGPVGKMKIEKTAQSVFENCEYYMNELKRLDGTKEGRLRTAISEQIGEVAILVEKIEFVNGKAFVPVGVGDANWKTPVVIAEASVSDDKVDITDIEDKIVHLLKNEDAMARIGHKIKAKIRNRSDLNYRANSNNGDSLNKSVVKGKTNMQSKISPNRGRNSDQQDQKKREKEDQEDDKQRPEL